MKRGHHRAGDAWAEIDLSAQNLLDSLNQIAGNLALQYVTFDAGAQRGGDILRLVGLGQKDWPGLGTAASEFARCFHAIQGGHANVHHDDVGSESLSMANGFTAIGSLRNNLHSFSLKQGLNTLPDYGVVVGEDDAGRQ